MENILGFKNKLFRVNDKTFEKFAINLFHFQASNNLVYRDYLQFLDLNPLKINSIKNIPFLPITFFKNKKILTEVSDSQKVFTSSGTTGVQVSRHYVYDLKVYEESALKAFKLFYGSPEQYSFFCLLPGYLERSGSSLVYMANLLVKKSGDPNSGFYLYDYDVLREKLEIAKKTGKKVFLLGVSFALLEMAQKFPTNLNGAIIMETGGMKGRGKELSRNELHKILKNAFNVDTIHSEYGMTELLSQAYAFQSGVYKFPPWAKALTRDVYDPFQAAETGILQIIDLVNIYSVSFIETQDIGRIHQDGSFEVLGRMDNSDLRGCNLMV
jgi:phenylacetate-coenzyme A ligase PaaK-like adenylate-forming protein